MVRGVPYEDKDRLKGVVKGIEWDKDLRFWKTPITIWYFNDLKFFCPGAVIQGNAKTWLDNYYARLRATLSLKEREDIPELKERWYWAFPHQRVDAWVHLRAGRSSDWSDPGTGKTLKYIIVGIESGALDNGGHAIVISPNSAKLNWRNELRDAQKQIGVNHPIFVHGMGHNKAKHLAILRQWVEFGGWLILNWESLRLLVKPDKKKHTDGILLDMLWGAGGKINYLAVDEAHMGKNRKAAQTVALDYLASHSHRLLEGTGSPITVKPNDLWAGLHRAYPRLFDNFWWFEDRYCNVELDTIWVKDKMGKPEQRVVRKVGDGFNQSNIAEFNEIASLITVRRRFEDVVDIPAEQYKIYPVELNKEQEQVYKTALENWFKTLRSQGDEEMVPIPNVISQITYLRQILLDPNIVGFETGYTPAKTELLLQRLDDLDGQPLVQMSKFVKYINRLEQVMIREKIPYIRITGAENPAQRQANVEKFQAGEVAIALCGIDAAGVALTLTRASHMDFTDRDWTKARNDQAQHRIRRIGQRHPQFFGIYTVEGTVDDRIERSTKVKALFEQAFVNQTGAVRVRDLKHLLIGGE